MPGEHAKLSPSSAERWLECPASIGLVASLEPEGDSDDSDTSYAREGTAAHELGEIKASLAFGFIHGNQYSRRRSEWVRKYEDLLMVDEGVLTEMERHTDAYVELLQERTKLYPNSMIMLEQRMDTGVPASWGTSDAVIVSPQHVEIVDLKYGKGVQVEAENNPQLRLYALGALDTYGDLLGDTEVIRMTVHQPRMDHVLTEELTPDELRAWRESIIPIAEEALGEGARFGPSETACRWCPASGRCRAQLEAVFADDMFDADPAALTPEEMAEVLGRVPLVRDWLNAFEEAALDLAYSKGQALPGYKVVLSGGKRSITDPEGAIKALVADGFKRNEIVNEKVCGITELEKLLGKEGFQAVLGPYVTKGTGRPSLVPEDDPRPAINPNTEAAKEFGE